VPSVLCDLAIGATVVVCWWGLCILYFGLRGYDVCCSSIKKGKKGKKGKEKRSLARTNFHNAYFHESYQRSSYFVYGVWDMG
jgi:hypothetical protein